MCVCGGMRAVGPLSIGPFIQSVCRHTHTHTRPQRSEEKTGPPATNWMLVRCRRENIWTSNFVVVVSRSADATLYAWRHIATLRKAEHTNKHTHPAHKEKRNGNEKKTVSNKNIVSVCACVWCPFKRNRPSLLFELEQDRASHRQYAILLFLFRAIL